LGSKHGKTPKSCFHVDTAATVFEAARLKGYEKLSAFVRADNIAALTAYLSQRFRIIGTAQRQAKINGKYVDEILIERFL